MYYEKYVLKGKFMFQVNLVLLSRVCAKHSFTTYPLRVLGSQSVYTVSEVKAPIFTQGLPNRLILQQGSANTKMTESGPS